MLNREYALCKYAFYFFAFEMMIGFNKVSGERLNANFIRKVRDYFY